MGKKVSRMEAHALICQAIGGECLNSEEWDSIPKDKPVILIDEKGETGDRGKGTSSHTFTLVSTTARNPKKLKEIYDVYNPGYNQDGKKQELKYSDSKPEVVRGILSDLVNEEVEFRSKTIDKKNPNLPKIFSPSSRKAYSEVAKNLLIEAMASSEDTEFRVYLDTHTSLKRGNLEKIVKEAMGDSEKICEDVQSLRSKNEPLLQIADFPTGTVGQYAEDSARRKNRVERERSRFSEDDVKSFRKIMLPKLVEEIING